MKQGPRRWSPKRVLEILGIEARILVCAIVLVVILVLVAALGLGGLDEVIQANRMQDRSQSIVDDAMAVQALALDMQLGVQSFLLTGQESFLKPYREAQELIDRTFKDLTQAETADERRTALAKARKEFGAWRTGFAEPAIKARREGKDFKDVAPVLARLSLVKGQQVLDRFKGMMEDFRKEHETLMAQSAHIVAKRARDTRRTLMVGGLAIIVLTIALLYFVAGANRRASVRVESPEEPRTRGRLPESDKVSGKNEVAGSGAVLNPEQDASRGRSSEILSGLNALSELSSEVVNVGAQLALGASKASAAVSQTTTTAEELRQAAILTGEKAKHVAESSQHTVEISDSGDQATQATIEKMKVIKEQMQSIAETVVKLREHSQTIEAIINVVKDLADQSNVLAVNASIEAARAGEQGKGFAVVAQEIKTLADQSRKATQRIWAILGDTRKWVSAVVTATEEGTKAVDAGLEQSVMTGEAIRSLSESVATSSKAASVIDAQSDQQITGVEQVAAAMVDMEQVMRQNLEAALQLESASGRLQELCESLTELMEEFRT